MASRGSSIVLVACVLTVLMAGCGRLRLPRSWSYPHAMRATLTDSAEDHNERVSRILAHDRRALIEDLDLLFMTDRQGRLNRWHDR